MVYRTDGAREFRNRRSRNSSFPNMYGLLPERPDSMFRVPYLRSALSTDARRKEK